MLLIPSINKSRSFEGVERKVYGWISDAPAQQTERCVDLPWAIGREGLCRCVAVFGRLLSADRQAEEKKQILEDEFHIMMTEQLESEVREMCNLSVGVMEQGIERGMKRGIERGEARFAELTKKLMEQNRTEDIIRATSDPQFKITLYQEFGIQ